MSNTETVTLSTHPTSMRFLCWRNEKGERVSRFFLTRAEALRHKPGK